MTQIDGAKGLSGCKYVDYYASRAALHYIRDHGLYNQADGTYDMNEAKFIANYQARHCKKVTEILKMVANAELDIDSAYYSIVNADFPHPSVTATVIIHNASTNRYLLVRRKFPPYAGYMAFPGGFAEPDDDSIEDTAIREIKEECGLDIEKSWLVPLKLYRAADPRGWVFDYFYVVSVFNSTAAKAAAGDDAGEIVWVDEADIREAPLAFHHKDAFDLFISRKQ